MNTMLALVLLFQLQVAKPAGVVRQLMVLDSSKTHLINQKTGLPVFMLGDDCDTLMTQLSLQDAEIYLADRQAKGINWCWSSIADNTYQVSPSNNFYGEAPFSGSDFTNFNSAYWGRVDSFVALASKHGVVLGMDPGFVGITSSDGYFASYGSSSCATLTAYGQFLGNRYKNADNVIWVLGGDFEVTGTPKTTVDCLGQGIKMADSTHLMTVEECRSCGVPTYNSFGGWTGVPTWLDLNWIYPEPLATDPTSILSQCQAAYAHSPFAAPFLGEGYYENEHSMTPFTLRQQTYQSTLTGCYLGSRIGNNSIWTFGSPIYNTSGFTWQSQLNSTGYVQLALLGQLFRSREHWKMAPDSSNAVLTGGIGAGTGPNESAASCTSDGLTCIVYDPLGNSQAPQIAMAHFSGTVHAWWWNPQNGATTDLSTFTNSGTHTFTPADGNDWVLVLDLNSASLCTPGSCTA